MPRKGETHLWTGPNATFRPCKILFSFSLLFLWFLGTQMDLLASLDRGFCRNGWYFFSWCWFIFLSSLLKRVGLGCRVKRKLTMNFKFWGFSFKLISSLCLCINFIVFSIVEPIGAFVFGCPLAGGFLISARGKFWLVWKSIGCLYCVCICFLLWYWLMIQVRKSLCGVLRFFLDELIVCCSSFCLGWTDFKTACFAVFLNFHTLCLAFGKMEGKKNLKNKEKEKYRFKVCKLFLHTSSNSLHVFFLFINIKLYENA